MAQGAHAFPPRGGELIAPEPAGHAPHFRPLFEQAAIIDAEFEDVVDEPADAFEPVRAPDAPHSIGEGRGNLFERRTKRVAASIDAVRRGFFPAALVTLCAASFWVSGGHAVLARLVSGGARSGPLEIADVTTRIGVIGGLRVAIVNGTVRNTTGGPLAVPAIGVTVGRSARPVRVRALAHRLGPGEATGFRARLPIGDDASPAIDVAFLTPAR